MAEKLTQHQHAFGGRPVFSFSDSQADVDVSGASGSSNAFDVGHLTSLAFTADLTALTGGTTPEVTFTFEDSPDGTNWYTINTETALDAVGAKHQRLTSFHKFVRVSWATTGSPATATASFLLSGR